MAILVRRAYSALRIGLALVGFLSLLALTSKAVSARDSEAAVEAAVEALVDDRNLVPIVSLQSSFFLPVGEYVCV